MFALIKSKNYFFGRKILFTPSQRKTNQFRSFGNVASNLNLSPAVRHLIFQYNLNPSQIQPTGPKGLILKGDVLKFMATPKGLLYNEFVNTYFSFLKIKEHVKLQNFSNNHKLLLLLLGHFQKHLIITLMPVFN